MRKRKNKISKIQDQRGDWHLEHNEMYKVTKGHFMELFTTSEPDMIDRYLEAVDEKVIDDMKNFLAGRFTALEVKEAVL